MIERIDKLLWNWGDWASSCGSGYRATGLTMRYEKRGVMSANPVDDNPEMERLDRIIASFPPYLKQAKKAIMRKYLWRWVNDDIARDLHIGKQKLNTLIDRAHVWIDAKLEEPNLERKKIFDMCAHAV